VAINADDRRRNDMREAWIDRWKGMLILLVVLGHVVGGGGNLAAGSASNLLLELWRVIYIFHMPSFFVLAVFVGSLVHEIHSVLTRGNLL